MDDELEKTADSLVMSRCRNTELLIIEDSLARKTFKFNFVVQVL